MCLTFSSWTATASLRAGWPEAAVAFLDRQADAAAVCGRLRERHPDRSVYNWLCDREWDRPTGEVRAFAGNVMIRAAALKGVGGYREDVIAAEEDELCVRLRQANWRIWRLADEMALHDAAMLHFGQWWKDFARRICLCARCLSAWRVARTLWRVGILPRAHIGALSYPQPASYLLSPFYPMGLMAWLIFPSSFAALR